MRYFIQTLILAALLSSCASNSEPSQATASGNTKESLSHFGRAYLLIGKQKYGSANTALNQAIETYPKTNLSRANRAQLATMHSLRGSCLHNMGQIKSSWKDFNQGVQIDPYSAYPLMMRAVAHSKAGNPSLARADLKKGLSLKPSNQIRSQMEEMLQSL